MPHSVAIAVLFLLTFLFPVSVLAEKELPPMMELKTEGLSVVFPDALRPEAENIAGIYPGVRANVAEKLGLPADIKHAVVLVPDHDLFVQASGSSLIVAFANSSRDLVVVDYTVVAKKPYGLKETLEHELCHLVLREYVEETSPNRNEAFLPRWLNEGVCQWASNGVSELAMVGGRSGLEGAVLGRRTIPLKRLESGFPGDPDGLRLAYEEGLSAVEFIVEREGREGLLNILALLREGQKVDIAISRTLGMTHSEFEEAWLGSLKLRYTWITWLSSNLDFILFVLGGALLVLAFIRAAWKMLTYKDDEDEYHGDIFVVPPPPGKSSPLRRLRSRRKGKHVREDDEGPDFLE